MYLKSLEINGFKSFADRTKLDFHQGVTGIVGPNGCGKSNVVDAIRWVLGETSAKALRGGEMADVIFNGTDKRKPLGMAEVMLTLADCEEDLGIEFNEVSVGRRVYRDGKSEYLINRKACRLKDINDLFMDTGIGRSSYSIMEQGKIDMLLSSKPEDRRAVFEEAAGITKFKHQKKEALRKLDYTEANLDRISDVIDEQRRQMASLQRQAAKARRYQTLLDQVKVLDTHLSHRQYQTLNAERSELETSVGSLRTTQDDLQQRIEDGQNHLNESRAAFQQMEEELSALRQREVEQQNRIQGAKNRIEFNEERRKELFSLIERNESDIQANQEKLSNQEKDLEHTDESLRSIGDQIAKQEEELDKYVQQSAEIRKERAEIDSQLQENRSQLSSNDSLIATFSAQIESQETQIESSQQRLNQVGDEIQRVSKEQKAKAKEGDTLAESLRKHEEARERLQEELAVLEKSFDTAKRDLAAARQTLSDLHREYTSKQTRLEALKQLVAKGEGFEKGTQEVLKGLDQPDFFRSAVRGVVANFIQVETEYVPAIEAALGHHLQAVLVADSTMAQSMMESLRKGELGQASLIPEDFLKSPSDMQLLTLPNGAVAWAMDKVKVEGKVQPVVNSLLDNVLIVENLTAALELRREMPDTSFATLQGEFLTASGVFTGGASSDGQASILKRQNEIRSLETEVEDLGQQRQAQEKLVGDLEHQVKTSESEVEAHRERLQQTRVALSTVEGQHALVQRELQQFENKLDSLNWEEKDLSERKEAATAKLEDLKERKRAASDSIQELTNACSELEERLQLIKEREAEANDLLSDLRTSLAVEKRAQEALEQQRSPMTSRLHELKDIIERRKSEIGTYNERIENAGTESAKLRNEIEACQGEFDKLSEQRREKESERAGYLSTIEQGEAELVSLRQEVTQMADQRGKEEIRKTQLDLRIENLTENIRQRYQLDLENFEPDSHALLTAIDEQRKAYERVAKRRATMAGESYDADDQEDDSPEASADDDDSVEIEDESQPDWEFVEGIIGELKQKLDSMGPVNLDAIEEYDELEERFNFMQEQHDDLVKSKEELLKVITTINRESRKKFIETFEQVRENFKEMFTVLFGKGAQANLVLLDDEDPLECGIEIIAKPPGKKLQSISLLSGGERSMTAVALLFSIYMVKPSPFCVLDELDAPLDEANIGRFIRVLDRFIEKSQFIIVTHSKRTMSRADVMYGVSMEEFGVSKTLSIHFSTEGHKDDPELVPSTGEVETAAA